MRKGEPVTAAGPEVAFTAPWQAEVFALVATLIDAGVLEGSDWSRALGRRVAALAATNQDPDAIWGCWVAALEDCLLEAGIAAALQLTSLRQSWAIAAEKTPHGDPIILGAMAYRLAALPVPAQSRNASAASRTRVGPR